MYIELHTSSAFSFLDGASLPATLVERAAELGYTAVALLDRDGLYGAPQFYRAAKAAGLKAIVGAELTMASGTRHLAPGTGDSALGTSLSNSSECLNLVPRFRDEPGCYHTAAVPAAGRSRWMTYSASQAGPPS